jgi:hypothetical protein
VLFLKGVHSVYIIRQRPIFYSRKSPQAQDAAGSPQAQVAAGHVLAAANILLKKFKSP